MHSTNELIDARAYYTNVLMLVLDVSVIVYEATLKMIDDVIKSLSLIQTLADSASRILSHVISRVHRTFLSQLYLLPTQRFREFLGWSSIVALRTSLQHIIAS